MTRVAWIIANFVKKVIRDPVVVNDATINTFKNDGIREMFF